MLFIQKENIAILSELRYLSFKNIVGHYCILTAWKSSRPRLSTRVVGTVCINYYLLNIGLLLCIILLKYRVKVIWSQVKFFMQLHNLNKKSRYVSKINLDLYLPKEVYFAQFIRYCFFQLWYHNILYNY